MKDVTRSFLQLTMPACSRDPRTRPRDICSRRFFQCCGAGNYCKTSVARVQLLSRELRFTNSPRAEMSFT